MAQGRSGEKGPQTASLAGTGGLGEVEALGILRRLFVSVGREPHEAVGLWVAMKSKPGVVILTPPGVGGTSLVEGALEWLAGGRRERILRLAGHPWWAPSGGSGALWILAQGYLTAARLEAFLSEAGPNGPVPLCFILQTDAGPGEVWSLASSGLLLRPSRRSGFPVGASGSSKACLYYVATMEAYHATLPSRAWRHFALCRLGAPTRQVALSADARSGLSVGNLLVRCRRFRALEALEMLPPDLPVHPLQPLHEVRAFLMRHRLPSGPGLLRDAYLWLGNAWSGSGQGLYHPDSKENVRQAGDAWITNSVLPRLFPMMLRRDEFRYELESWLPDRYPRAAGLLSDLLENMP